MHIQLCGQVSDKKLSPSQFLETRLLFFCLIEIFFLIIIIKIKPWKYSQRFSISEILLAFDLDNTISTKQKSSGLSHKCYIFTCYIFFFFTNIKILICYIPGCLVFSCSVRLLVCYVFDSENWQILPFSGLRSMVMLSILWFDFKFIFSKEWYNFSF